VINYIVDDPEETQNLAARLLMYRKMLQLVWDSHTLLVDSIHAAWFFSLLSLNKMMVL
jgi:hypothetical protein